MTVTTQDAEVGGFAGLVPTPHQSGEMARELGISKAGNERIRVLITEIAWGWLRYQPDSALAQWSRARRIGIVALARKLLIALWRYLTTGVLPDGATLKPVVAERAGRREERDQRFANLLRGARN